MANSERECYAGQQLTKEVNGAWPHRDKHSEGVWASTGHHQANPSSDHEPNEKGIICAHDYDEDLLGTPSKYAHGDFIQPGNADPSKPLREYLLARCRSGKEKRIHYIISEEKIYSGTKRGNIKGYPHYGEFWGACHYTGPSLHKEHAHVSFYQIQKLYDDRSPFGIVSDPVPPIKGPFVFAPKPVTTVGPIVPDVNWQNCIAFQGGFLVAIAPNDTDSLIVRMDASGAVQLDSMTITGTNAHQTQFAAFADGHVWYSVNDKYGNDICELSYRPGTVAARKGKALHVGTDNAAQVANSPTGKYAIVREFNAGNKETYYRFRVADLRVPGAQPVGEPVVVTPNDVATQGFGAVGDVLYILKGNTDDGDGIVDGIRYMERKSFATGKHVATQDLRVMDFGQASAEPEGMDGGIFYMKTGNHAARRLLGYTHNF